MHATRLADLVDFQ